MVWSLVHFVIYGYSWCFTGSQIELACGSCNFQNLKNVARAHITKYARVHTNYLLVRLLIIWDQDSIFVNALSFTEEYRKQISSLATLNSLISYKNDSCRFSSTRRHYSVRLLKINYPILWTLNILVFFLTHAIRMALQTCALFSLTAF